MATEQTNRASAIFLALSGVAPAERARLIAEQCGHDDGLRAEVERLLDALELPDDDSILGDFAGRASLPTETLTQSIGTIAGDFVVIRQIGSGGAGVVYLAHQKHPPRIVALKVLRREFMKSTIQRRFEIEAELLAQLHHPGIAQVYAAHPGDATTPPFIAMELVNGPSLTEYADSHTLSLRDRIELLALVCDAVQHAHQRGIIHRDLKPGNILVNDEGQPKVLDFGVARTAGAQVSLTTIETETGQLLGTLAYMSPEQVEATPDAVDTRSDIHALGVILFRLLAGRLPFGHDDPPLPELARRIVGEDAPRLGTINPALRGDLEIIVARALAKEKDRRYASASAFANDLRRYLAGQPISASADSTWYVVRRQLGRYRLALTASAAAVVALAGLALYANVQRQRADQSNIQLQDQLATSTIDRGRLVGLTGNLPVAEELVWREFFRRPDSRHAKWTLWDIYSREPSYWGRSLHQGGTLSVRFGPDNRRMLSAGQDDGFIRIIDVESGRVIRSLGGTPRSGTRRAFFTPDGSSIVAGSKDGTLRVWDVETGELRLEMPRVVPSLMDLAVASEGSHAVTVAEGGSLQLWSLSTRQMVADLSSLAPAAAFVAADPSGTLVFVGGADGMVTLLDAALQTRLWRKPGHASAVISVAISHAAHVAASGGTDALLQLFDLSSGERVRVINTENGSVRNIAFDPSGTKLATAGQWRTQLWDLEDPLSPPRNFGGAEGMTDLDLRGDLRFLATCHGGWGLVRLWDLTADSRTDQWTGHNGAVTGLAIGADAQSVLTSSADGSVAMWRPGQTDRVLSLQPGGRVGGLAISADKRWVISTGEPGTAAVWNAADGRRVAALKDAATSRAAVFFDRDQRVAVGELDGTLKLWDWVDGRAENLRRFSSKDSEVLALAAHGTRVFVAHRETLVVVRDGISGRELRRLKPSASPFSLAVTPDGRLLAAGTWPGLVNVWEIESGRIVQTLKGPTALITALDFNAEGDLLALSSRDGSTRLWDLSAGQWLATVASRNVGAERLRFLDDQRLAIGYADGEVEIRDLHYFFRYAAGHSDYQLTQLKSAGDTFPKAEEVLAWSRRLLSAKPH